MADEGLELTITTVFDNSNAVQEVNQTVSVLNQLGKATDAVDSKTEKLNASLAKTGKQIEKVTAQTSLQDSRTLTKLAENDNIRARQIKDQAVLRDKGDRDFTQAALRRSTNLNNNILTKEAATHRESLRRETDVQKARSKIQIDNNKQRINTELIQEREKASQRAKIFTKELQEQSRERRKVEAVIDRAGKASPEMQGKIAAAVLGIRPQKERAGMIAGGVPLGQSIYEQLNRAVGPENAEFLSGRTKTRPFELGGVDTAAIAAQKQFDSDHKEALRENARIDREAERARLQAIREADRARKLSEREFNTMHSEALRENARMDRAAEQARKKAISDNRNEAKALTRDLANVQKVLSRTVQAPAAVQSQIRGILNAPGAQSARMALVNSGLTQQQAVQNQLQTRGIGAGVAQFASGGGGGRPPGWGPPPGPGGPSAFRRGLSRFGGSLASGVGLGVGAFGGYAVASAARAVVEATQTATAYERQMVAAQALAGSQEKLNALLEAYAEASGGAVDKVTSLSNVTRLMATGFADNAPDVERFVRATRGASIALGKPQESIIQETQLAISNTSQKRLDQIGLGIEEVTDRVKVLRKENADWTREQAFQEAVLDIMEQKYSHLTETLEGQATGLEKLSSAWSDFMLQLGKDAKTSLDPLFRGLAALLNPQSGLNQGIQDFRDRQVRNLAKSADLSGVAAIQRFVTGKTVAQQNAERVLQSPGSYNWPSGAPRGDMDNSSPAAMAQPWERPPEQMEAMRSAYDQMRAFEKQTNAARLAQIEQYESQRASIIANYGKQVVREEQDFVRQRARGLRDYERSIMDIMRDAQEREVEMQEDLDEVLAEANEDSEKRVADINKKYHKDREKAEKDHIDRLMKAAGQLDAIAILEERKRFKRENEERKESHDEALSEEKESLEERRQDAIEAHAERLEDARKADAKRLEDMRISRKQQLEDEDEDRRIRNERAAEDHAAQIAELDKQHGLTMARLAKEAEEQRQLLQDALEKDLAAVGIYIEGYQEKVKKKDEAVEKWIDDFVEKLEKKIKDDENKYSYDPVLGPQIPDSYASGGPVRRTGPAILHSGEFVMSRGMVAAANNSYSSSSNRSINLEPGSIVIQTSPGYEQQAADMFEERIIELLGRV